MDQQQRTRWSLSLAAGVVILVLVVAALISGRAKDTPAPPAETPVTRVAAPPPAARPILPPPALTLEDLTTAAAAASGAFAAGDPYPADQAKLVGRRFEMSIAFGCAGPSGSASNEPARWDFDLKARTITLTAQPQVWTDTAWVRALGGGGEPDLIRGFWIPRPWLASGACPAPRAPQPGAPAPAPAEPTVGLVEILGPDSSRAGRRGDRPYRVVRKATEDELATAAHEFRLLIKGRVTGFEGGQAVRCHAASIDQRPACLVGVGVESVAFIDPGSGEVLAEWRD